jgi:hypothetical protein
MIKRTVPEAVRRRYTETKADLVLHLKETGWKGVDWIDLAQDRTSDGCCKHGNGTSGSKNERIS